MGIDSLKATVKNMVNSNMKFGDFNASVENLSNKYKEYNRNNKTAYYTDDNKLIAIVEKKSYSKQNSQQVQGIIWDKNTNRVYKTDKQPSNPDKNPFTSISGDNYTIIDNNGNGYVDENDTIYLGKKSFSIKDFLNYENSLNESATVMINLAKISAINSTPRIIAYMENKGFQNVTDLKKEVEKYANSSDQMEYDYFINVILKDINIPQNSLRNTTIRNAFFDALESSYANFKPQKD